MNYEDEYSPAEKQSFLLHVVFAICCVPLYQIMPTQFGLLISPYLFFIALCPKPQYLLPIIIHMSLGSQQRSFFCLGCFLYVLFHSNRLYRYKVRWIYFLYLSLVPYFIWVLYSKYNGPRIVGGIGEVTNGISEYMAFSVVFWATIAVNKFGRSFFRGLLVCLVLYSIAYSIVPERLDFSRTLFYAWPFFAATLLYCVWSRNRNKLRFEMLVSCLGITVFIANCLGILKATITFTIIGLVLMSCLYTYISIRSSKFLMRLFSPINIIVFSIIWVLLSASLVDKYGGRNNDLRYDEVSMSSWDSFKTKLQMKAFDDRAHVWRFNLAYVADVWREHPIWNPQTRFVTAEVYDEGAGRVVIQGTDMGAHNTMLELLRNYGFYGGLGLYILYILYFSRRINRDFLLHVQSPLIVVLSVCLAQGVVGGHTGHYPILIEFSPIVFACLGTCWRQWSDAAHCNVRAI